MASFTLSVSSAKLARYKTAKLAVHPNIEEIPDPSFVGDPEDAPQLPKYTDNEWLKEIIRRHEVSEVKRGEAIISKRASDAAAAEADTIVT